MDGPLLPASAEGGREARLRLAAWVAFENVPESAHLLAEEGGSGVRGPRVEFSNAAQDAGVPRGHRKEGREKNSNVAVAEAKRNLICFLSLLLLARQAVL